MPPDLTVFAAQHLTYVDVGLAALVLAGLLYRRHHATVVYWIIASGLMLTLSRTGITPVSPRYGVPHVHGVRSARNGSAVHSQPSMTREVAQRRSRPKGVQ